MYKSVLLISSVHPANDPRIVYKIAPSIAKHFKLTCMIPRANPATFPTGTTVISLPNFNWIGWRLLLTYPVILWKSLKVKPDIIHFFVPELIPIALFWQWLGATVIYEVQENLYQKLTLKTKNNGWLFRNAFYFFDRIARKKFHFVFTEKAYLKEYDNIVNQSIVVHNFSFSGLNTATQTKYPTPTFLYSGVISNERGFDVIIKALSILSQQNIKFRMHFFGYNRLHVHEMKQIDGFDTVEPYLLFHEYTDYYEVLEKGKSCLAGLAILKAIGDYPQSYPSKIFDYMSMGIPVITSDFPLYRNIIKNDLTGFCVNPLDAALLASKMKQLIENRDLAKSMGNKGYQLIQTNYNWETEANKLLTFYDLVTEKDFTE